MNPIHMPIEGIGASHRWGKDICPGTVPGVSVVKFCLCLLDQSPVLHRM